MTIRVTSGQHRFTIPIPNWLVFNAATSFFSARIVSHYMKEPIPSRSSGGCAMGYGKLRGIFPICRWLTSKKKTGIW